VEHGTEPGRGRVLIVDDSEFVRTALADRLAELGHEILTAANGLEALDVVEREDVEVILLDVQMPVMDGKELCARLKASDAHRSIPVLMLSTRAEMADRVSGLRLGADDYLPKDCDDEELGAKVEAFLRIKRLHDNLELKRRELATANEKLLQLDRMKQDMSAMIVHDIKNPLNVVMGAFQAVRGFLDGSMTKDDAISLLALGEARADAILKLANELLEIARMEDEEVPLELSTFDLRDLVAGVLGGHAPAAERRGLTLGAAPASEPLPLRADRDQLARAVENLVSNAVKYTPDGGRVEVRLRAFSGRRFGERGSRFLEIVVEDSGAGIAAADLPRLFDRYYRAQARRRGLAEGTGLGLTIVKRIVEAHGGWIHVDSRLGQGSVFRVTLPADPATRPTPR
jgi:signal transduction histidine kinase